MTRHHNEMAWKSSREPELIVTVGMVGLMMTRNEFQKAEKTRAKGPVNLDRWTAEGGFPRVRPRMSSIFRLALTEDSEEVFPHQHLLAFEEIDQCLDGGRGIGDGGDGFERTAGGQSRGEPGSDDDRRPRE